ncbi:MAG: S8 family serine peptidase [bacterium]
MKKILPGTCVLLLVAACTSDVAVAPPPMTAGSASASQSAATNSYIIDFTGNTVPTTLSADVAKAGGSLNQTLDGIGLAVATSDYPGFAARAAKIAGVRVVTQDRIVQWTSPARVSDAVEEATETTDATSQATTIGATETFRKIQWNVDAVSAPAAWAAGQQGAGARVAVIDGGIWSNHIDVAPNLDAAHSASFVPGKAYNTDVGTFWHGTHVAGIIAAPANNIGTVGIAPKATIIGVKALDNGSGAFSWIINAIYYAATPIAQGGGGADIINMSLGASFMSNDDGAVQLKNALSKATTYAHEHGVTVIASAGNNATDLDHTKNLLFVPAMSAHVIAVSATGPLDFAHGATNFDRPASYTNYGQSAILLAGPGGDAALPGNDICSFQRFPSGSSFQYCWVLDMVMAPCRGSISSISSYCWAAGTSMSSPAVAGVAALIIGKHGKLPPAQVESILRQSADDLGKPGNDDYYGRGRVNAFRAIQ